MTFDAKALGMRTKRIYSSAIVDGKKWDYVFSAVPDTNNETLRVLARDYFVRRCDSFTDFTCEIKTGWLHIPNNYFVPED